LDSREKELKQILQKVRTVLPFKYLT
jgi:hypothetical protein